ncbi:hypothetical protein VNO77_04383 [Canavalia gladiata]|uniref:Uncharacterized protein n=1 Tax=Canavalia gladiata TaxID=3824 RepID=A0AAN9N2X7_CANGL
MKKKKGENSFGLLWNQEEDCFGIGRKKCFRGFAPVAFAHAQSLLISGPLVCMGVCLVLHGIAWHQGSWAEDVLSSAHVLRDRASLCMYVRWGKQILGFAFQLYQGPILQPNSSAFCVSYWPFEPSPRGYVYVLILLWLPNRLVGCRILSTGRCSDVLLSPRNDEPTPALHHVNLSLINLVLRTKYLQN